MTLTEFGTRVGQYLGLSLLNRAGESPSTANYAEQYNRALEYIARRVKIFDDDVACTFAASTEVYSLKDTGVFAPRVVKPHFLRIGTRTLKGPDGHPGFWSLRQLQRDKPTWRDTADGTVLRAVVSATELRLWPAPDATDAALTAVMAADVMPADMTSGQGATELTLPESLHEAACWIAAYEAALANVSSQWDWQRLESFRSLAFDDMKEFGRTAANSEWGETERADSATMMRF